MNPNNPFGNAARFPLCKRGTEGDFGTRTKFKSPLPPLLQRGGCRFTARRGANALSGMNKLQRGFSIISAIFLLVVLAFLGTAMVTLSTSQHQSSALDMQGTSAYQAARAGIEWGAFQVLQQAVTGVAYAAACTPGPTIGNLPAGTLAGTLAGYAVAVTCSSVIVPDSSAVGGNATVWQLTSVATQGVPGTAEYVERSISVSIGQ